MSRDATILFIRTTRANLDAQASANALIVGEPYFITDENRFALGTSASTYQAFNKQGEGGAGGGSPAAAWGQITGTLSNQTDLQSALSALAPLAGPSFTGTPTAPTQTAGNSSTRLATTAFVQNAIPAVPSYSYPYQNSYFFTPSGARGTMTLAANTIYLVPFSTTSSVALGSLGVSCSSAPQGSGNVRFGIYTLNQNTTGRTFNILSTVTNIASFTTSSSIIQASYQFNYTLPAGKYFLAMQTNSASTLTVRSLVATDGLFTDGIGAGDNNSAFGAGISGFAYDWNYSGGLVSSSSFYPLQNTPLIGLKSF